MAEKLPVDISFGPGPLDAKVMVNGHDITDGLRGVKFEKTGSALAKVTLIPRPGAVVRIRGAAVVEVEEGGS